MKASAEKKTAMRLSPAAVRLGSMPRIQVAGEDESPLLYLHIYDRSQDRGPGNLESSYAIADGFTSTMKLQLIDIAFEELKVMREHVLKGVS